MGFAAAPVLVLTGLVNWDLLAVACVAGAFWAWSRGRPVLAGVMIGLGDRGEALPALPARRLPRRRAAPPAAARLRPGGGRGGRRPGLAVNLPVMVYGFEGWKGFWTFNSDRGADLGSLWLVASRAGHRRRRRR